MTKRQGIQEKVNISKSQNEAKNIAAGSRGGKGEILLAHTLVMRNRGRFKKKPHTNVETKNLTKGKKQGNRNGEIQVVPTLYFMQETGNTLIDAER